MHIWATCFCAIHFLSIKQLWTCTEYNIDNKLGGGLLQSPLWKFSRGVDVIPNARLRYSSLVPRGVKVILTYMTCYEARDIYMCS